jgi:hypothetical protein
MKNIFRTIPTFILITILAGCGNSPEQVGAPEQAATTSPATPATPVQAQAVTLTGNHTPVFSSYSAPFTGHNAAGQGAVEVKQTVDMNGSPVTLRTDVLLSDASGNFDLRVNFTNIATTLTGVITLSVKPYGAPGSSATNYLYSLDSAGNSAGN